MNDVGVRHKLEELGVHVRETADPRRRIEELPRLRLRERDQLFDVLHWQRRMHREHAVAKADQRDRLVRFGVLDAFRQLLIEQVTVCRRREHERVAVGRRRGGEVHAEDGTRSRTVVHQDRLLETLRELRRNDACDDVRASAGRPRHEQAHGFLGPRDRGHARRCDAREGESKNCNAMSCTVHEGPL